MSLISHGADLDAQDLFEESSLHYAARNGDVEVVKALLIKGADVNKKNEVFNKIYYLCLNFFAFIIHRL